MPEALARGGPVLALVLTTLWLPSEVHGREVCEQQKIYKYTELVQFIKSALLYLWFLSQNC